jgi:HAD superfamily hydrolase (TIGR01509 family)
VAIAAIDTVVFDMDGVLSRPHRERRLALLSELSGLPAADIDATIFKSSFEDEAEQGLWSPEDYLAEFGRRLGCRVSVEQWISARKVTTEPDHQVLAIVRSLVPTYRVGMFTNNPLILRRHFDAVFPEAASLFGDRAVFSAELGRRKPDPAAFLLLADRLGCEPMQMLFLDDDPAYVDGARAAGLHAEACHGHQQLAAHLRAYGVVGAGY